MTMADHTLAFVCLLLGLVWSFYHLAKNELGS